MHLSKLERMLKQALIRTQQVYNTNIASNKKYERIIIFHNTNLHFYAFYWMKIYMILSVVFASHIAMLQCIGFLLVVMRNPLGVRNFHSDHAM